MKKILFAALLISMSSCSITKMRYSRGFNLNLNAGHSKSDGASAAKQRPKSRTVPINVPEQTGTSGFTAAEIPLNIPLNDVQITEGLKESVQAENHAPEIRRHSLVSGHLKPAVTSFEKEKVNKPEKAKVQGEKKSGIFGLLGFVAAIGGLALLSFEFFVLALVCSIVGVVLSSIGIGRKREHRGLAGLALGMNALMLLITGIFISVAMIFLGAIIL